MFLIGNGADKKNFGWFGFQRPLPCGFSLLRDAAIGDHEDAASSPVQIYAIINCGGFGSHEAKDAWQAQASLKIGICGAVIRVAAKDDLKVSS